MKRLLGCVTVAVGISVLSVAPFANARMGGFGGPGPGSAGHWGGGWHDNHFHGHSSFFFVGAFPFWYPYYGSPYYCYYYDYPSPYYYDSGPPAYYYNDQTPVYPGDDTRSYLILGHDAGKGLRNRTVTWDWFVEYLQAYIVNAPSWVRDEFQRGFVSGYGNDGEAIYKKGIHQVGQRSVSGAETTQSPGPSPNSRQY